MLTRPRAALSLWVVVVVGAGAVLHASGHGALASPPITTPARWSAWLAVRSPVEASFAIVRLVAIVVAWQLGITTTVGALTRAGRAHAATAAVDRVTAAPLRALLSAAFGVGLATTTLVGSAAASPSAPHPAASRPAGASAVSPPAIETMVAVDGPPVEAPPVAADGPSVETMTALDGPPVKWPNALESPTAPIDAWLVHRGDSFWSIARHVETDALDRDATTDEVSRYWRRLMAANHDKYRDADLIYPGQSFDLPPP